MARKPSSSHRGSRTPGAVSQGGRARRTSAAGRANDTARGEAGRTRLGESETSLGPKRAATRHRSGRMKRSEEEAWTPNEPAASRRTGRRRAASRAVAPADRILDPEDRRAGGRDGTSERSENRSRRRGGPGTTETGSERQGMGRGHRGNFDESDDDATTRGQSTADATSDARDSGVRRRSRAMDDSTPLARASPPGGRSTGRRSDW